MNLYHTGNDLKSQASLIQTQELELGENGIWHTLVEGDQKGIYYTYTICVNGKSQETADVYARACGVNGMRSMVFPYGDTMPDASWLEKRKELAKCPIIYELHIKDFSSDLHSGISKEYRGKYLAFTEEGTTLDGQGKIPTGIDWLKDLGVTYVHLLPFFDFGSVDESKDLENQFNWGYDPVNYNVPEGSYSTDPYHGEVRIRECKDMIHALHKAGIGVIMDVVFNHTFSLDSAFQKTVPDYYYRKLPDGRFANGSACGNDTASEKEMFREYMIDSVCYWAKEYELDGFRFDLMGLHDVETMNAIRHELDKLPGGDDILMYGEPWMADDSPMEEGAVAATKNHVHLLDDRIAAFCDLTRDAIKGSVFIADEAGFVNGKLGVEEEIKHSVCAWCDGEHPEMTPKSPKQIISYVSAHDNYTLWDKLIYTLTKNAKKQQKEIEFEEKNLTALKQNKMAAGIYFTCLGTVFFQAGEEFARTKKGNENSFDASPQLNALDWGRIEKFQDLTEYYKGLIAFRKGWQEFYERDAEDVLVSFCKEKISGVVAFEMKKKDTKKSLFVVYNSNEKKILQKLSEGAWKIICDGNSVYPTELRKTVTEEVIVDSQSVFILERVL